MRGNIDLVSPEGIVEGWCWNEQAPEDRVTVAIRVDGEECGRTIACHFRKDLQEAKIGDGGHFFRLLLPDTVLRHRRSQKVSLVDPDSGKTIGEPYTVRFDYGLRFDDRLSEVEARSRLVESRLTELLNSKNQASAELFAVVGAFFQRLSEDLTSGKVSRSELKLSEAIQAATRVLSPIVFPAAINPLATILVEANCPLDQLHGCLVALRRASASVSIRVVILDVGSYDDTALICSLVRGVQYLRAAGDIVSEWREAGTSDPSSILIFLSGYAVVDQAFLVEMRDFFELNPYAGAVGGCSLSSEGIQHTGFHIVEGKLVDCAAAGDGSLGANMRVAFPVEALNHIAVAFRRQALEAAGGLDLIFGDELWAAVIDLCFRLRARGWSIFSQPSAIFSLAAGRDSPASVVKLTSPSRAKDLLGDRWIMNSDAPSFAAIGYAAIIGQSNRTEEEMEALRHLRNSGFGVLYVAADDSDTDKIAAFQQAGARIVQSAKSFSDIPARIVFTASEEGQTEKLRNEMIAGAQLVVGLPTLGVALKHYEAMSLASPNA